jgi:PAS domain S-box-containing protein
LIPSLFQTPSALIVLVLTLLLTGIAWHFTQQSIENSARSRFEKSVMKASEEIEGRIHTYVDTLLSVHSLFAMNENITRADWKKFFESLQLQKRYPGFHHLSFARYVPESRRAEFEKHVREDRSLDPKGYPDFSVYPEGARSAYYPIEYIEPFSPIPKQFGFDIGSDPTRRYAVEQARDTGEPTSTGRIILLEPQEVGFAIRVPVYRNRLPQTSVEERRAALLGFITAGFNMKGLMQGVFGNNVPSDFDFEIFDGGSEKTTDPLPLLTKERLLYDNDGILHANGNDPPRHAQITSLEIAGRIWHIYFSTSQHFTTGKEEKLPPLVLFAGATLSLLLSYITWSTTTARRHAVALAEAMTADLRESEKRFRAIFDRAPLGIAAADLTGRFIQCNQKLTEILGYTSEELLAQNFQEITHPDDLSANLEWRDKLLAGLIDAYTMEKRYLRKEGGVLWANLTVSPIRDAYGEVTHTVAIVEDITDRREADEKLRKSEAHLRAIIDSEPECVKTVAIDGTLLAMNPAGLAMVQAKSEEEVVGRNIFQLVHPEDRPAYKTLHQSISQGQSDTLQFRIVGLQGRLRWMESYAVPLKDRQGRILSILSVTRDITERKQAEEALRESQRTLSTLMSNLPGMAYRCRNDRDWTVEFVSEGCFRLTGYHPSDLIMNQKFSYASIIHPDDQEPVWNDVQAALQEKKPFQLLYRIRTASGEEKWVWEQGRGIFSSGGDLLALEGFITDITERRRAEEELRRSEAQTRALLHAIPDMMFRIRKDGTYLDFKSAKDFKPFFPPETFLGRKIEEVMPTAIAQQSRNQIDRALASGEMQIFEYALEADGQIRNYEARIVVSGPEEILAIVRDVTERKQAEKALRIKTEQLAAVTDAMTAYLDSRDWHETSSHLLRSALHQTQSQYGFIGVVVEGPRLRIMAHEGVRWDGAINRSFYEEALGHYQKEGFLEFDRFDNLFGEVIRTGKRVVADDVVNDPRSGGVPPGHPPLHTFLGVPIIRENKVVGMIGVANRPGGYGGAEQAGAEILSHAAGVLYDNYRQREREIALEHQQRSAEKELRRSQEQLRSLSTHLHSMIEEERTRISREIHDELGQLLTILKMELSWLKKRLPKKETLLQDRTNSMAKLVDTTVQTLRKISTELRPGVLDDLGLTAAMEWQVQEFQNRTGMRCRLTVRPEEILLDPDRSTAVFRIFQETLTNIVRHADADEVTILLEKVDHLLTLEVKDNGRGITQSQITNLKSLGLLGIRERALLWGGTVQISGIPGRGTTVTVQIPL